jgi:pyruvate,water dikinase
MTPYTLPFRSLTIDQVNQVGGKNASLGEMFSQLSSHGIQVPDGFATTADAYYEFLSYNHLTEKIGALLNLLDTQEFSNLSQTGAAIRGLILQSSLPAPLAQAVREGYRTLCAGENGPIQVAVRSSATAEDLPTASFAGQHESYLNIEGEELLLQTCLRCYASLFTDRAIKYRHDNGFDHLKVALSVGVQRMVRSDKASSGVCFTIDPDSGFDQVILITGSWGLGENVVQGAVNPDEFYVFKPALAQHKQSIINKKLGSKAQTMIYATGTDSQRVANIDTPEELRNKYVLSDAEIIQVARWAQQIEKHYGQAMDIEWAKDGLNGKLYIVQARPETVHGRQKKTLKTTEYTLPQAGKLLAEGKGIGHRIISGTARILDSPKDAHLLNPGDILITDITNPDWDPIMKRVSAIVTNRGGRTSHAAIVARELGAMAVVGTGNATDTIRDGSQVTVVCTDQLNGRVYEGQLAWEEKEVDFGQFPPTQTDTMFILGDPDQAFHWAQYPNNGVGLLRMEFIINHTIGIHPMALVRFNDLTDAKAKKEITRLTAQYTDKTEFFVEKLAQGVATIAAAFYPKPVIVRMSDFKTNEYANLLGGSAFEPHEENPMLGFRGASRYYDPRYAEGFALECRAMKRVRDEMGLTNVKLMIPFCRTIDEGLQVIHSMQQNGLKQGVNDLEVYVMAEIPSNILLAREFTQVFDGFSIGSNDLTQLTLGIDRDSATVSGLFDENNAAVKQMIAMLITAAKDVGKKVGICGQAPSDSPEFTQFLITQGIDSVSFNPDAYLKGLKNIIEAESNPASATKLAVSEAMAH